jgi:hypothetical protein
MRFLYSNGTFPRGGYIRNKIKEVAISAQVQRNHGQWNAWIACPRPRPVRLKLGYRFWAALLTATLVIVPVLVGGFLIVEWRAHPPMQVMNADFWGSMPFVVLPPILLLLMFWIFSGHRRLVIHGEIAIGKVTEVRLRRRGPVITCEFLDRSGRLITTTSPDSTRSFSPGMDVPVFFSPENPQTDQIALCGSVYEVADAR